MAYISFELDGQPRVGWINGDQIAPLAGVTDINVGADALQDAVPEALIPRDSVTLLPASPSPRRVLCVGLNYFGHIEETKREVPKYPVIFAKYASSLIAGEAVIELPEESTQVDWEGELAVVIGKEGRRIPEEDAGDYILGYAVANDITMRDFQYKTHQWLQGKAWDRSTPLGPVIVTPAEVDISTARITTTLNGQTVQDSDLSKLMFPISRLIAELSVFTTLQPGDVILTGTPSGVGYRRDPQVFLAPGDTVTVEVEGVGRITNSVAVESLVHS